MKKTIVAVVLLSTLIYALPSGIESIIKKSGIPKKDISIYIKEAGKSQRVVAALNASATRTPASVIKVLSTYAAVLELGFDYRWPTQFYRRGSIRNGVLKGDLLVKGFGDPTLSSKDLPDIIAQLKAKGIKKISGNIVIDRSYFNVGTKNNSGFDAHTYSPYNAMPDAMMFNERISTICVAPNKNSVRKKYVDGSYILRNNLQRVNKPCRGRYSWPMVKVDNSKNVPEVIIKGKISKNCGNRNICKVVTKPYQSFYYALKDAMKKAGIKISGGLRLKKISPDAKILFTHYSRSLEKIVSKTAKKSNNLYARHLLLFLGAKKYGAPATLEKGRAAVKKILQKRGALGVGTLHIDNGSGLSRTAKLNARLLATMFDNAYTRYGKRWMHTLSIAGVDGTIKRRFRGTIVRNRAWMKTGTLKRVKNIGGYVKSKNGRYYTAVILVNTKQGNWRSAKLENDVIAWLVRYKGRGSVQAKSEKPVQRVVTTAASHVTNAPAVSPSVNTVHYYVQTGAFSKEPSETYLSHIKSLGLDYNVDHDMQYKVYVGPYKSESEARAALAKVREEINPGAFLVNEEHQDENHQALY